MLLPFGMMTVLNLGIVQLLSSGRGRPSRQRGRSEERVGVEARVEVEVEAGGIGTALASPQLILANVRARAVEVEERHSAANASRIFICITTSYLLCNSLAMLINVLERIPGRPWLMETAHDGTDSRPIPNAFYIYATDAISFLFMLTSVFRVPIYLAFSPTVRHHFAAVLRIRPTSHLFSAPLSHPL